MIDEQIYYEEPSNFDIVWYWVLDNPWVALAILGFIIILALHAMTRD